MDKPFYGIEHADILPVDSGKHNLQNLMEMFQLLQQAWCRETCAPRMQEKWTRECPTLGQCSVTAFLVQDYFGGRVYGIPLADGSIHCYNVIQGHVFDLTSSQFKEGSLSYQESDPEQFRESHFQSVEKRDRYLLLKNRLLDILNL